MPPSDPPPGGSEPGGFWDRYVEQWKSGEGAEALEWPGDEWGTPKLWDSLLRWFFAPAGVGGWERAVEIGQGSGKYTLGVLAASPATVRAYDVSPEFLRICEQRCGDMIEQGRLSLHLLDSPRPDQMLMDLEDCGWRRRVDGFYSIDSMVHVDLQELVVYLITAAAVLKPGGKLIVTLADVTEQPGFERMIANIAAGYHETSPGKFKWVGPDVTRSVLERLGFEIEVLFQAGLYILVVASLARPEVADELESQLCVPD